MVNAREDAKDGRGNNKQMVCMCVCLSVTRRPKAKTFQASMFPYDMRWNGETRLM